MCLVISQTPTCSSPYVTPGRLGNSAHPTEPRNHWDSMKSGPPSLISSCVSTTQPHPAAEGHVITAAQISGSHLNVAEESSGEQRAVGGAGKLLIDPFLTCYY